LHSTFFPERREIERKRPLPSKANAYTAVASAGVDANADYEPLHALAMNEGQRWKKKLFSEQG
jgi:hypothetical protein